ncbi:MAG: YhbY family RNA-binding protein, partial [Eubacteriales bacterium]
DALRARELIKLKVLLEASAEPPKELAQKIADATGADVVQVVGGSIVLFKENPELHQTKAPVKKVAKKTRVNTISKPRITRERKPAANGSKYPERKAANPATRKTEKAPAKHTDKKITEHKPLHQGRPRPVAKPGKAFARKVSDKKRG